MDLELAVQRDGRNESMRVAEDMLVFEGRAGALTTISFDDVAAVEIEQTAQAWQEGRSFARGILRSGRKHAQETGVLLLLRSGERLVLLVPGRSPLELRGLLGPLLDATS